jgi:acetyltransferase-like isoleucine patch superfamily enzyme
MNDSFKSNKARVSKNCLVSSNAKIYGHVEIGPNAIIEQNVIIGHPSPLEQTNIIKQIALHLSNDKNLLDIIYDEVVLAKTVIEEGVIVRSGSVIYSGTFIKKNTDIAHNCLIRENCTIGQDNLIITGAQIMASVIIGNGCRIAGTLCNRTYIGNCSSMLGHAMHRYKTGLSGYIEPSPKIGNGVIVGRETSIIGGIEIGDFSIVGAGSVITKSVPNYSVWIGNPAKQIKSRKNEEYFELKRKVDSYDD